MDKKPTKIVIGAGSTQNVEALAAYGKALDPRPVPGATRRQSLKTPAFKPPRRGMKKGLLDAAIARDFENFPVIVKPDGRKIINPNPEGKRTKEEEAAARAMSFVPAHLAEAVK